MKTKYRKDKDPEHAKHNPVKAKKVAKKDAKVEAKQEKRRLKPI